MSDAHNPQSLIHTPKQLVAAVAGFFLVIVIGIILLVTFVTSTANTGAGTEDRGAGELQMDRSKHTMDIVHGVSGDGQH